MKDQVKEMAGTGALLLSLFTGVGALAASSCCALPLALSLAGIGGAWVGGLSGLVFYRPWFLIAAGLALAAGWTVALRRKGTGCTGERLCARPARNWLTFGVLGLSTLLVGVAAAWDWIEPAVMMALLSLADRSG